VHRLASAFVLGYHGCDEAAAEALLAGDPLRASRNEYDWLGEGAYFWEANPLRGLQWAQEQSGKPKSKIKVPAVVGAVIDLGFCLDLTTSNAIEWVKEAHEQLVKVFEAANQTMPENSDDLLRRNLDCAVINLLHTLRSKAGKEPIQTTRGVFVEGRPIYHRAGFQEKTHIQIAVRDLGCVKGIFRVPKSRLT